MSGTYEYYGGNSISSIDEYLDRINRMHRTPTTIDNFSDKHSDHRAKIFHQAPDLVHKEVHFTEHKKHIEVDRHGKHEVYEEKTIDMEADGLIQKRHKNFEKGY